MRVSELAERTGCHLETVRYYERIGLLPPPVRLSNGYRQYGEAAAAQLKFIVRSKALGFHLEEIRSLLRLASESSSSCAVVDTLARNHLKQVTAKQHELARLARQLRDMIDACHNDTRETCTILRALSSHSDSCVAPQS